jgi:hypothetical protein
MIGRKNDGTTKMTRQRATKNTFELGMTMDSGTVDRYLDAGNPGRPLAVDKWSEVPKPVIVRDGRRTRVKLVRYENFYYFVCEDFASKMLLRSITYGSKERAMDVYKRDKIHWKVKIPLSPRPNASS